MINIAEILKDCPEGTKLYSPICGDCTFEKIHLNTSIFVCTQDYRTITFNVYGQYFKDIDNAECLLFPSKKNRDWTKFRPFKDGDIISSGSYIAIFHKFGKPKSCGYDKVIYYHCWCYQNGKDFKFEKDFGIGRDTEYNFATDKEKQKLFDIIKANGYKWNPETKTLEKMIIPKFKAGDKIVKKDDSTKYWYVQRIDINCNSDYYSIITKGQVSNLHFKDQDNWELVPTHKFKVGDKVKHIHTGVYCHIKDYADELKGYYTSIGHFIKDDNVDEWEIIPNKFDISTLKAYDKVLVRDDNNSTWINTFFGFYDNTTNKKYPFVAGSVNWSQCIPYEGNQHLLGTNNDCDEYYKNW